MIGLIPLFNSDGCLVFAMDWGRVSDYDALLNTAAEIVVLPMPVATTLSLSRAFDNRLATQYSM